jgi:hypothetical protein
MIKDLISTLTSTITKTTRNPSDLVQDPKTGGGTDITLSIPTVRIGIPLIKGVNDSKAHYLLTIHIEWNSNLMKKR